MINTEAEPLPVLQRFCDKQGKGGRIMAYGSYSKATRETAENLRIIDHRRIQSIALPSPPQLPLYRTLPARVSFSTA